MTQEINGIKSIEAVNMDLELDFNVDGTVDIADYDLGSMLLNDNKKDNDGRILNFTESTLKEAFQNILNPTKQETITSKDESNISKQDSAKQNTSVQTKQDKITTLQSDLVNLQKETDEKIYNNSAMTVRNLSEKGTTELQSMLDQVMKNLESQKQKLEDLKNKQEQYKKEQKQISADYQASEETYNNTANNLENENTNLETMSAEYSQMQETIADMNKKFENENINMQNRYQNNVNNAQKQAEAEYDANSGIDYQTFVNNKINAVSKESTNALQSSISTEYSDAMVVKSKIDSQTTTVQNLSSDLNTAQINYESTAEQLQEANDRIYQNGLKIKSTEIDIKSSEGQINNIRTVLTDRVDGSCLTGTEVLAQISDEEKQYIKTNNIDITTCYVTKGSDDKWHIFLSNGQCIGRGSNPIESMSESQGTDKGTAVYRFTSVNEDLTQGEATWTSCNYSFDPLAFDVDGNGIKTTNSRIVYDIDGDGKEDVINNSADWVLAFDKNKDGKVGADGSELFGDNTDLNNDGKADGYKDGFEALKALAKQEGLISNNDNMLDENDLKQLSEKYGLAMTKGYGGEVKSLQELGITQINLAETDKTTLNTNFDGKQNDLMTQEGATFVVNGNEREYADIWNKKFDTGYVNVSSHDNSSSVSNPFVTPEVNLNTTIQSEVNENLQQTFDDIEMSDSKADYDSIENEAKMFSAIKQFFNK